MPLRCFYWTTTQANGTSGQPRAPLYGTFARLPSTVRRFIRTRHAGIEPWLTEDDYKDLAEWLESARPGDAYGSFYEVFAIVCIDLNSPRTGDVGDVEDWDEAEAQEPFTATFMGGRS